jgi:hypothetical protein
MREGSAAVHRLDHVRADAQVPRAIKSLRHRRLVECAVALEPRNRGRALHLGRPSHEHGRFLVGEHPHFFVVGSVMSNGSIQKRVASLSGRLSALRAAPKRKRRRYLAGAKWPFCPILDPPLVYATDQ